MEVKKFISTYFVYHFKASLGSKGIAFATGSTAEFHGAVYGPSWTRLDNNANPGDTSITLESSVSWKVGSQIVLATTDYLRALDYHTVPINTSMLYQRGAAFPDQTEVLTITAVNGNTVTFQEPLKYLHWG